MYMANASPNAKDPTQPIFHWLRLGSHWVCRGQRWVRKAFQIPTCWYPQREILALGVQANARPQRYGISIAVEYRLKPIFHQNAYGFAFWSCVGLDDESTKAFWVAYTNNCYLKSHVEQTRNPTNPMPTPTRTTMDPMLTPALASGIWFASGM